MSLSEKTVCVHMAMYLRTETPDEPSRSADARLKIVEKNIEEHLKKWAVKKVDLYVHSNSERALEIQRLSSEFLSIQCLFHDFSWEDPRLLTWKYRPFMATQKDTYDIFIYIEDDIGIPAETLEYWWTWKDRIHEKNLDVGFLLVESINQKDFYSSNVLTPSAYLPISIQGQSFVHLPMRYAAGWIADRAELGRFMKSPYWDFHLYYPKGVGYTGPHICESSAIGYSLSYPASIFPTNQNGIEPKCFFYHLSNTYLLNPSSTFGKLRVEEITRNLG